MKTAGRAASPAASCWKTRKTGRIICALRKAGFDAAALGVYTAGKTGHIRRITGAANGISEYLCVYDCQNSSTVDILDPRITDAFLALTHEKYFERFGAEFGKGIAGFFTDEPQYFRYETAYTPVLLTEYKKAYGADILDLLGALFVDCRRSIPVSASATGG